MTEDGTLTRPTHTDVRVTGEHPMCELRDVLDRVGDKWSVLVMSLLGGGSRRYSELQHSIEGISQRMLTLTLRSLERDGLVSRKVTPTSPPRVDYALTPVGATLSEQVAGLMRWAEEHRGYVAESRVRHDAAQRA
ncbi:helix-turn-helix domain-containing protein [Saccharothrix sp.]|uniref:winged helix-turn-helix transcriptional regulator n=1 Tax=Saccharothrix sp. TaxID=1873460 RepID=UPI002811C930|nr:helix-turn-helix domain-containing protein [Saccharothrix sp.]